MRKVLFSLFVLSAANFGVKAQMPILTDSKPWVFDLGKEISPLSIANTGGAVPTSVYCSTTTLAGTGAYGSADGAGVSASFNGVTGVAVDKSGNVYAADTGNNKIRKINLKGEVSTFAGNGSEGSADGHGTDASFNAPCGLAIDGAGNIYVADSGNNKIRKISPNGVVTTLAGNGHLGDEDVRNIYANFNHPCGVTVDAAGNVYVADTGNNKIRKIDVSGVITTLAGNGNPSDNDGIGISSSFKFPFGLTVSSLGDIYVADSGNNKIRKINAAGLVTTVAGNGSEGSADGRSTVASFKFPFAVTVDASGNIYVADTSNHKIRKIGNDGVVTTISGSGIESAVNGTDTNAGFDFPYAITLDSFGNAYIADYLNNKIRKMSIFGYTVYPDLPSGLNLDTRTGVISGTPSTVSDAADYTVTAVNASGSASAKVNITVEALASVNSFARQDLHIYPNPAAEILNVKTPENAALQNLQVIDMYGKVILEAGNVSQIDVNPLKKGVYLINAQTQEKSYQMKFVKS